MPHVQNKFITNEEAMTLIESDVFLGHQKNRFALGLLSEKDVLSYEADSLAQAYLRFRANVYVDQTRMLEDDVKGEDGTEFDKDGERSTHLVVLENRLGEAAIFACARIIKKSPEQPDLLPVEEFFSEAFIEPASPNSVACLVPS